MPLTNVNPDQYQQQLDGKAKCIISQFAEFDLPTLDLYKSPALHFRLRAEFKVWHQGDDSFFVMYKPEQPKTPIRIDSFPIGSQRINQLMTSLLAEIKLSPLLRNKLFQIEFLTTLTDEALVTMIYHKALNQHWQQLASTLQEKLAITIIGRSRKQKVVLSKEYVTETLSVNGKSYSFQQVENSFTQSNGEVNQKMLGWALQHSAGKGGDLVELYCGNGNFTVVMAQNFNKVLATEISKTSVKSAKYNIDLNNIDNVRIARMSSEEFSSALAGERAYRRLHDIDLSSYNFSTILVDPPRAGLDEHTEKLLTRFNNILYISCNPDTLYKNLQPICKTHQIKKFAIFDQFPYTDHIECGVILSREHNE
ncbi:MAG: tRNA (uridine(54)-C5)-methyltransferase TrmA [Pseudomonadales bacterium]